MNAFSMVFYTPEAFLTLWAILLLLLVAWRDNIEPRSIAIWAMLGVVLTLLVEKVTYPFLLAVPPHLYLVDQFAIFFKDFFLVTLFLVLLMGREYIGLVESGKNEFFILPLFTTVGLMLLASAGDFVTMFVALELVTISLYILVSYHRTSPGGLEAGMKYLVMGGMATGFLVYGIAFVFGSTSVGTLQFSELKVFWSAQGPSKVILFGMILIIAGIGFKIAAVPFHAWAPDVYQGAPAPVTALLGVASKAAGFLILLRLFVGGVFGVPGLQPIAGEIFAYLAAASMILGTFAALTQRNMKRLLGYSSIANAGFILMGLCTLDRSSVNSVLLYLSVYLIALLLAFYVICHVSASLGGEDLRHFTGLAQRSPVLAFAMTVAMASLAGLPPLAGFAGKLGVFAAAFHGTSITYHSCCGNICIPGFSGGHFQLIVVGLVCAIAGLYYYLKVVSAMYWQDPADETALEVSGGTFSTIWILVGALVVFGIWQQPLLQKIAPALNSLGL